MVSYKGDLYKLLLVQDMVAPTIPVSAKENLGDPIDIKVDIIHPEPVAIVAFLVAVIVRTQVQHREAIRGIHEYFQWVPIEAENASLLTGAQKPENLKHEDIGGMIKKDIPKEKLEIE
ncbi:hypothetical protein Tco_0812055 [Tanacetum coccineum]